MIDYTKKTKLSEDLLKGGLFQGRKKRELFAERAGLLERAISQQSMQIAQFERKLTEKELDIDLLNGAISELKHELNGAKATTCRVAKIAVDRNENVKKVMKTKISQAKFAKLAGISRSTVQRFFTGKTLTAELAEKVKENGYK